MAEVSVDRKNSFRRRRRSTFIVRYDAILTVIVASCVAFCLGMAAQFAIDHAVPCATEDSTGCYWNAHTRGNGLGHDVVNP